MSDKNKIMILCKVVDNFGDIGVVYRLARALSDLRPTLELTLVVSNLDSFHKMASQIDPKKQIQDFKYKNTVWKIVDWHLTPNSSLLTPNFSIILECFQCGRPDWLEDILFEPDFTRTVQIIQIDYLTAEDYADEFHLLKSGTRKTNIKKVFFMPGFTEKTAGLIINRIEPFKEASAYAAGEHFRCRARFPSLTLIPPLRFGTPSAGLPSLPHFQYIYKELDLYNRSFASTMRLTHTHYI